MHVCVELKNMTDATGSHKAKGAHANAKLNSELARKANTMTNGGTPDELRKNTFGDYKFEEWVPEHTREIIRDFWGCFGRTYKDWLDSPNHQGLRELCHHGPGPNGFGMPPNGATIDCLVSFTQGQGPKVIRGRYLHRWNNMGSLIDEDGKDWTVSSGDWWVRVFTSQEEKKNVLAQLSQPQEGDAS